jgi:hypothetical protein
MTTIPTRCHRCDRQLATQADYDTLGEGEGEHLCWSEWGSQCEPVDWRARAQRAEAERDEARGHLAEISAIRDSIVGAQTVNWSEHIYPLVNVLTRAGFKGVGFESARKNVGTLIERTKKLTTEIEMLTAERDEARRERDEVAARVLEEVVEEIKRAASDIGGDELSNLEAARAEGLYEAEEIVRRLRTARAGQGGAL